MIYPLKLQSDNSFVYCGCLAMDCKTSNNQQAKATTGSVDIEARSPGF